ncbi:MAG: Cof-type HAD-IIB family hydrolase [Gammaproteobacteria bacterium]
MTTNPDTRIHLLALDVDGTLLTSDQTISEATRAAIQAVTARGIRVVLASARSPYTLRPIMAQLDIEGYAIAFSGGMLCRLSRDPARPIEILSERSLPVSSAQTIVRLALARGISVGWFMGEAWHIQAWDETLRREAANIGMPLIASAPLALMTDAPHKIQCMVAGPDRAVDLHRLRADLPPDCIGHFTHETYLEIFPHGVDKATGLQQLGHQLGIELHEMAAVGDGENDVTMLQTVGLGIAMGHAPASVRQAAAWTTSSNDEDGVALAIERIRREGRV